MLSVSAFDDNLAAERGRLLAAQSMANNPEHRKTIEAQLGVNYCRLRWPEAYHSQWATGIGRLFDRLFIPFGRKMA